MPYTPIKKENRILLLILPLIVALCFGAWYVKTDAAAMTTLHSDTPEWDLRGMDTQDHYVRLNGGIAEYVPNAFLTPEEFARRDDIRIGRPKEAAEYYTARFRVLTPDDRLYAVTYLSVDYADRIFINGRHMQTIGSPGDSAASATPLTTTVYYTVYPQDGVIEVVHQASNFVHREGGNPAGLVIGSIESAGRYHARQTQASAIIMGGCAFLFLVHIVLFLLLRSYRTNLYFALFCLVWFLRTGYTGAKVLIALFPYTSWYLAFRIEYMAIPLAALLLMLALDAMLEGLMQRPVKIAAAIALSASALFFSAAPTVLMSESLFAVHGLVLLTAAYVLARFFRLFAIRRDTEQLIVLLALVVFVYASIREMLYHADILIFPAVHGGMLDFAALVFILFQMAATFLGTMRGVVAARERERELALENAALDRVNRLTADLMRTVSHELRTPLAVMMGYAQLVAKEMTLQGVSKQATSDLEIIASEAKRLSLIVSEMQEVSLSRSVQKRDETVSLEAVIRQAARLYAPILERRRTRLTVEIPEELPPITGGADGLTQVLFNLLTNAGKHTENGEVKIAARCSGGEIAVTVSDTGSGIPPELLPHVWERGVTGDEGGAGLGLAICREIIEAYGGSVRIQNQSEKGAAVTFLLPAEEGGAADVREKAGAAGRGQ